MMMMSNKGVIRGHHTKEVVALSLSSKDENYVNKLKSEERQF